MSNTAEDTDAPLQLGRLHPICCTVDVTAEIKDRFLKQNKADEEETFFVFIDDLTEKYDEEAGIGENIDCFNSPFKGKRPHECYLLLQKLAQDTGSDVDWHEFAVFDERSLEDDTCLLVSAWAGDGGWGDVMEDEVETNRSAFDVVAITFALLNIADMSFDECQEEMRTAEDGVWRFRHMDTFPGGIR